MSLSGPVGSGGCCTPALGFGSGCRGELLDPSGRWPRAAAFPLREPRGRRVTPPLGAVQPGHLRTGAVSTPSRAPSSSSASRSQQPGRTRLGAASVMSTAFSFWEPPRGSWVQVSGLACGVSGARGGLPAQARPGGSPRDPGNRANLGRKGGTGWCGLILTTPDLPWAFQPALPRRRWGDRSVPEGPMVPG